MIACVPIAIVLPGVPGDALLIGGLALISPSLANRFKQFYKKYPLLCKSYAVISTAMVIGFFSWRIYENLPN